MGLLLMFLGLVIAGAVADYVYENELLSAPNQTIVLLGRDVTVSGAAVVVGAFVAGMLVLLLFVIGIGLLRGSWGRRRTLKKRIAELEWQNTELRSRERLQEVVQAVHTQHIVTLPEAEEIEPTVPEAREIEPTVLEAAEIEPGVREAQETDSALPDGEEIELSR